MTASNDTAAYMADAYGKLDSSDLHAAGNALDAALASDFENEEVIFALSCVHWWRERMTRVTGLPTPYERADSMLAQWKPFMAFQRRTPVVYERARYAFKRFVFGTALRWYQEANPDGPADADAFLRFGRCLKGMGDFRKATERLEAAANARKDDAETLAELADAYALVNEARAAKALFREAYFLAPQRVNLAFLESSLIERLAENVSLRGFSGAEQAEWIPVYGCLMGIFNIKRELKAAEVGRLRQSIYELENELRENAERKPVIVPRLLNRYFWLIDHLLNVKEDRGRVDEILLKVRMLDPSVYKQYVS